MYLKSLTLKGFKSFASSTTLKFEPGICAIVGPNGSGKSNVVDALGWVMGEQGAKILRGGKMEDVIFAGTPTKQALGRAEVTLTIDNTDGALPIDYSEVSITRRMFRDGASEYEINGDRVRLMDVQELLSDSGIGREMHVIVGQGKLAEILESRPEERRAFIEEAAGILKHRRRKEKAIRKLTAMQANLDRVGDLTRELRRQLAPLGRQAKAAKKAQVIQAEARDARLRLAADDIVTRRAESEKYENLREQIEERRHAAEKELAAAQQIVAELEHDLETLTPTLNGVQNGWFELSALSERVAATLRIAEDRSRQLQNAPTPQFDQDPDELLAKAAEAAQEEDEIAATLANAEKALTEATAAREDAEEFAQRVEKKRMAAMQAVADRREGIARLAGAVDSTKASITAAEEQAEQVAARFEEARLKLAALQTDAAATEDQLNELENAEEQLNQRFDQATAERDQASSRCDALRDEERSAEREAAVLRGRIETLSLSLEARDAAEWLQEPDSGVAISGSLAKDLKVKKGWERAIAVALGEASSALTVRDTQQAHRAVSSLRSNAAGHAMLLIESSDVDDFRMDIQLPAGVQWALDLIKVPRPLQSSITALLMDAVVVEDLATAERVIETDRRLRAITRDGDARGWGWATGGERKNRSEVEIRAAITAAEAAEKKALSRIEKAQAALQGATEELEERRVAATQAQAALVESDTSIATVTKDLARLSAEMRTARLQQQRLTDEREALETKRDRLVNELTDLEERQRLAAEEPEEPSLFDDTVSTEAATAVAATRSAEMEARLAVRTAEERSGHVRGRASALRRRAQQEKELRQRAARMEVSRKQALEIVQAVREAGGELADRIRTELTNVEKRRQELQEKQQTVNQELIAGRKNVQTATAAYEELRETAHQDELLRAQAHERLRVLEEQIIDDLGIAIDELLANYGPDVMLPPTALEMEEYETAKERGEDVVAPQPFPFDRKQQEARLQAAEKDLARLGKVNPLALEEFEALQERYSFLSQQLDDIQKARKDLLKVVDEVDERIETVFEEAFHDVAREFVGVFSSLFPGGEGRLVLTDPDDMLNTGVEVHARPPGKKVKRLSLLSGGEKSLTALAMLVAIFKARPSPFYVLDEVEAALDDTNLQRLLGIFQDLREHSQLLIITHQKLTMDIADVLYGMTMRNDGITQVISQRMRPVAAPQAGKTETSTDSE
ncbi:MAG: chromosome segregation protein SMC [Lawsonella sp.]